MATEAMVVSEVPTKLRELGDQLYEFLSGQLIKKESVGRLQHSHLGRVVERIAEADSDRAAVSCGCGVDHLPGKGMDLT
jgi:hypothetical protein